MVETSIVLPVFNEEGNLEILHREIKEVLDSIKKKYEIIFVDDGSRDKTNLVLEKIKSNDNNVKVITFRTNFGQTAALDAGMKAAKGKVIITMDSDLQNDPKDIPRMLEILDKGFDIVAGWRANRKDTFSKRFISKGARFLRKLILKDKLQDSGCTLRAYKKECMNGLNLYGEMHRFIHILMKQKGFRIAQMKVNHRKRIHGQTKYTFSRTLKSLLDMALLKFWLQYSKRPIHFFGGIGFFTGAIGFLIAIYLTSIRLFMHQPIANRPMLLLAILLMVLGAMFFIFGLMADILVKVYYKNEESYSIKH